MFPSLPLKGAVPTHLNPTPCTSKDSLVPFSMHCPEKPGKGWVIQILSLWSIFFSDVSRWIFCYGHLTLLFRMKPSLIQSTRVRHLILDEHLRVVFRDGSHLQPATKPLKCRVSFSPVPPIPPTPHKREQPEACCPWERSLSVCWVSSMCNTPCCKMHWTVGAAVVAAGLTVECLEGLARTHRACELAPACVHSR